jgi:hypothetical protein
MPLLPSEGTQFLAATGVGPTIIARQEQMGFESFSRYVFSRGWVLGKNAA